MNGVSNLIKKQIKVLGITSALVINSIGMTNGSPIYAKAKNALAHKSSSENKENRDTIYGVGSVSKVYTVAAAMQLVEKGKLSLDQPITTYLPEFEMADPRYKDITVRMLMDHSSGLMGTNYSNSMLIEDNDTVAHDLLLERLAGQTLKADPGAYSTYCNDGFVVLELIIERISGEDFTTYLNKNIFKPLQLISSGTTRDLFESPYNVQNYYKGNILYGTDYCNTLGTGGLISTAKEVCLFGKIFFEGDESVLLESSKKEMAEHAFKRAQYGFTKEGCSDDYGLGWDCVAAYPFNEAGVQVLAKGGDLMDQHAMLMVAPKENISVSVMSSGGSSAFNEMLAQKLTELALEERGISIDANEEEVPKLLEYVPDEYFAYEGYYANNNGIYHITFPNKAYLQIESCDTEMPRIQKYFYAEDGRFIGTDEGYIDVNGIQKPSGLVCGKTVLILMTEKDQKQYINMETILNYAEMGQQKIAGMFAEKLKENVLNEGVKEAWNIRDGKKYYLVSEKYSSAFWTMGPVMKLKLSTQMAGYLNGYGNLSTTKIVDEMHAKAFVTLSGGMGRDLNDITISKVGDIEHLVAEDFGMCYEEEKNMAAFEQSINEVRTDGKRAIWYTLGGQTAGKTVAFEKGEKAAVYIYDQYDQCVFNTYMKNVGNKVILPKQGKIVFVGENNEKINVYFEE